jgi:16S rRNA (cytosine1402-N4)-methyltransferase
MDFHHEPVLLGEVLESLRPKPGGRYLDATVGLGGHAEALLEASGPDGTLVGLDRDPQALEASAKRLARFGPRVVLRQGSFAELGRLAPGPFDGLLMDLGVSSLQLDRPERGFSFRAEGPLDMRMDPGAALTAADWLNRAEEGEIVQALFKLGEEPQARRVARAIVQARQAAPLESTTQVAALVESALGGRRGKRTHPATRTFQALRLVVNRELEALQKALPQALQVLASGGRMAVISFHSLEDRLVKEFMALESRDCICEPGLPACRCGHQASLRKVTGKPRVPGQEESDRNPRSRSAKLRVAEKL